MKFRINVVGTETLLMHNARLADPLDEWAKKLKRVSAKQKKTEDDYQEMAKLEFLGGLYYDQELGPFIPGQNFERCIVDAGKKLKLGTKLKSAMVIQTNLNPLSYKGPRDLDGLLADQNFRHRASAKVGVVRIMRTRPQFRSWSCYADGDLDETQMDFDQLRQVVSIAGNVIGMGDWRPRFGRFDATLEKI